MAKQVHYEIFGRRGNSPGWSLLEAQDRRDEALEFAKQALGRGFSGVKVVKETYDDATGDFMGLTIFEDGTRKVKLRREAEDSPPTLPCRTPEDLYSVHARVTLGRLFADTLARWKLTVTELIHRADMLEKLEATGTLFQHAVQKVALAQAGDTGDSVVTLIRALNDLADRAIQRVYREEAGKRVVACANAEELAAFAMAKAGQPEASFLVGMALAKYLAPATNWNDKLDRALEVLEALPPDGPARAMLSALADAVVSEILGGSAALQQLIGPLPDLGNALLAMSDLYIARLPPGAVNASLMRLSAMFGKDRLLDARTALGRRVLAELKTHKRLGATVEIEMRHLRAITSRLVLGPSRLVPHEDIVGAVTLRSRHLVQSAPIEEFLKDTPQPTERILRLLALEENIVGAENKRRIWDNIKPILASAAFEATLGDGAASPLVRLARAAELQTRIMKSGLPEVARHEGGALVDALARKSIEPGRFAAVLAKGGGVIQTMQTALDSGHIPKGACDTLLRELLKKVARAA
ncbi:hypothetical protein sos41_42170 [Alphaproteobacteria bacterium SO-S41]|nr:hypothetical protein sos41_42170 [Alphaproteobacteria bacterium SO-S41]